MFPGIVTDVKPQPWKQSEGIALILAENFTDFKLVQSENAASPTSVTLSGIAMEVMPDPAKADALMALRPSGSVTLFNAVLPLKVSRRVVTG